MYIDSPLKTYLDDLAARKPAPGGGSAAALTAAIGTSLMSMVANYTAGNPKYKAVESKVSAILTKVNKASARLKSLVDEDVEAYGKLSKSLKTLKEGSAELEKSFKDALNPPFEMCKLCDECLRLCGELVEIGNKNLITDIAIAAILLEGAFFSAKFNVYINLKYIKDMDYIGKIHKVLAPLEEELPKLKEEILEKCEDVISK